MAALTEEQSIIRDQAKSWVSEQAPVANFRRVRDQQMPLNFEPAIWQQMIDMGWTGIIVPEQYGGSGLGYLTFGVILEEVGRHLTASPLFASAYVGATALMVAGTEQQQQDWLPKIVDGSTIATVCIDEGTRHDPRRCETRAEVVDGGYVLNGAKSFVMEGMAATTLIVSARLDGDANAEGGLGLFIVDADAQGLSRQKLSTVDSRGYANVVLEGVQVSANRALKNVGNAFSLIEEIVDRCSAGVSAEMLGTASQAFDMTLEYLKTREQFGRVIGSFQALGHRAAMLYTSLELARSCVEGALTGIDDDDEERAILCSLSKCRMGDFVHDMSRQLIQIHGGIGMTDEFDAGFYLKRARVVEAAFGNQGYHRNRYATLSGF